MSAAMPARRSFDANASASASALGTFSERHTATSASLRLGRADHHRQTLDTRGPADRRRVRAAERFDQSVIAAAGDAPCLARRAGR